MNRTASLVLLVLGLVLLAMGWDANRSVSSGVSRLFTGAPTDRAMLLLIGGGLLTVAGLGGLTRGLK
ncbi:MAG: DUF3185 family protein [Elusimicrobiota bacterium]|nr:DUF3185 family protein [Elusimicrobiota bacterium]